jgi:uncharacterized protein (TIGR02598 family)
MANGAACQPPSDQGFSLIEVVIAVGVAAFVLVALLGLLPVGLTTFRSSMNSAVGTEIIQRVVGDVQAADFDSISGQTFRYFDEQGSELPAASNNAPRCIYWVSILPVNQVALPGAPTSTNMKTVTIMVVNNPAHRPASLIFVPTNSAAITFSTVVGRSK